MAEPVAEQSVEVKEDEKELARFGYKQELKRSMSGFGNFALSFSVISILTGAVALYGQGLSFGGPIEMLLGWPLVTIMTLTVAMSLAELASAYPTAGALYHWSTILGGVGPGWWTAWFNLIGQIAVVAGVDYALANFIATGVGLQQKSAVLIVYAVVLLSHGILNHIGITVVTILNEFSAWYHLAATALLVGALLFFAPLKPISFLLEHPPSLKYPFYYSFLIGLLQAQWTLTGYDASAHAAEETVGAHSSAPKGMVNAVWVSGVAGFIMLIALTLAIPDLNQVLAASNPIESILISALGKFGVVLFWLVNAAMWFCGLSSVTSNSRMLFAFARDGGAPGSKYLARVSPRYRTPAFAVWGCLAVAFCLAIYNYEVIASIGTIAIYTSYGLPILFATLARRKGRLDKGAWSLGRWSKPISIIAIVWVGFITVLFVLPPNQSVGVTFAVVIVALLAYYFAWAQRRFKGPSGLKRKA